MMRRRSTGLIARLLARTGSGLRSADSQLGTWFSSTWSKLGTWFGVYDAIDPRNDAMRDVVRSLMNRDANGIDMAASIPMMRGLARNFERNNPTPRAVVEGIVANVIGSGIALEPDTGNPLTDAKIRPIWLDYLRSCGPNGEDIYQLESMACREMVVAGEALWLFVEDPELLGRGQVPLRVIPYEAESLDRSSGALPVPVGGNRILHGVELDQLARAVAYWIAGDGDPLRWSANDVAHIFEPRRPTQIRGETWFAPILTTIRQERDLVIAELQAAKNTAAASVFLTSPMHGPTGLDSNGDPTVDIPAGAVIRGQPGETAELLANPRPSQQIAPFRKMLRGDVAGSSRIGQRWINRDASDINYSSMRGDMLDQERLSGPLRDILGHRSIGKLYRRALPYLCLLANVPLPKRDHYRLLPDGQPYVDPQKDVAAACSAIAAGLSTHEAEIGKRGGDYKQVWAQLKREQDEAEKMGITIDLSGKNAVIADPNGVVVPQHQKNDG
jgi:lambda family phage portal protein